MPEYIRALIVIIVLTMMTFLIANRSLGTALPNKQLRQWQLVWLGTLLVSAALANFWLISLATLLTSLIALPLQSAKRLYYYLLLICTLPLLEVEIPGFANIRYFFELNYSRLMVLCLLLPLLVTVRHKTRLFSMPADRYIVLFIVLVSILEFRDNTFTNGLRTNFLMFIDVFVPYYAITRLVNTSEALKTAIIALFIGIIPFALIGAFEVIKHWFLYSALTIHIFDFSGFNAYTDIRAGEIRASALFSGPIVLGYVMIIAGSIMMYLQSVSKKQMLIMLGMSAILLCLLATKARGPWIGFAIMLITFLWTGRGGFQKVAKLSLIGILLLVAASVTDTGRKYIDMLPIIGETRSDTIEYRVRLLEQSWIVFQRSPLFGDTNFRETPEMESLRQGQDIIDVVNSYVGVALAYGSAGLILFCMAFVSVIYGCKKVMSKLPTEEKEMKLLGRALFACLVAIMFTIATVSSINYIPILYWVIIGLTAAYIKVASELTQKASTVTNTQEG